MEIVSKDNKIKFTIKNNKINGLYGNHLEDIIELIKSCSRKQNMKLVEVPLEIERDIHEETVKEYIIEYMKSYEIYPKNLPKKIIDALRIVGLSEDTLKKNVYMLSSSEQKLLQLVKALLLNPDIIILNNSLSFLDMKERKRLLIMLKKLQEKHGKIIIIISNDVNLLYGETDYLIIYKNDKILVEDSVDTVFQRVDFLKKHDIEIPDLVEFTYLAKKSKKAKIDYHKDIRDIIKDIYKHV